MGSHLVPVALHSLALTVINIASIFAGYFVYTVFRPHSQIMLQVPVALVLSTIGFLTWHRGSRRFLLAWATLQDHAALFWTYAAAFAWAPVVFVPMHLLFSGYLTSWGNVLALWIFQAFANIPATVAVARLALPRPERAHRRRADDPTR